MPRTRKIQVTRQQKHLLLLALFLIKYKTHRAAPTRKEVLNYVRIKKLILLDEANLRPVASGEPSWENDLSWRREDLCRDGFMFMPSHGKWAISPEGEQEVINWCATVNDWVLRRPNWQEILTEIIAELYDESVALTPQTIEACLDLHNWLSSLGSPAASLKPTILAGQVL